jgi:WD40 repeat protein
VTTLFLSDLPVNDVAWSPCGTKLATVGSDSNLLVWDCEEAALGPVVTTKGSLVTRPLIDLKGAHSAYIRGVSWDPVGKVSHHRPLLLPLPPSEMMPCWCAVHRNVW